MKSEVKQANIVNIRFNDATLEKLDRVVRACGYKSRSDCIKSLVEERYNETASAETQRAHLLEMLNNDDEVRAAVLRILQGAR